LVLQYCAFLFAGWRQTIDPVALAELPQDFRARARLEFATDEACPVILTALPDHHFDRDANRFRGADFHHRSGRDGLIGHDAQAARAAIDDPAEVLLRLWLLDVEDNRNLGAASAKSAPLFSRFVALHQERSGKCGCGDRPHGEFSRTLAGD